MKTIDRFRTETGSDYFDIMLLHCMTDGKWQEVWQKEGVSLGVFREHEHVDLRRQDCRFC